MRNLRVAGFFLAVVLVLIPALLVSGATVYLRNGLTVDGEILRTEANNLVIATYLGTTYVPINNVGTVVFSPEYFAPSSFSEVSLLGRRFEGYAVEIRRDFVRIRTWFGQLIVRNFSLLNYVGFVEAPFAARPRRTDVVGMELMSGARFAMVLTNGEIFAFNEFKNVDGLVQFVDQNGVEYHVSLEYIDEFHVNFSVAAEAGYDLLITRTGRKLYGKVRKVSPNSYEVTTPLGVERVALQNVAFTTFKEVGDPTAVAGLSHFFTPNAAGLERDGTGVLAVEKLPEISGRTVRVVKLFQKEVVDPRTGIAFVFVPAGTFKMGADTSWRSYDDDELPARDVYVGSFYVSKYPITVGQYLNFLRSAQVSNVSRGTDISPVELDIAGQKFRVSFASSIWRLDAPITGINWLSANAFCEWAGYQLPTEAQWEKAARGTDGRRYPWGNDYQQRYNDGAGQYTVYDFQDADVSPFGVVNMYGYPAEFCRDFYDREAYKKLPAQEPYNASGRLMVARLGARAGRITDRIAVNPNEELRDFTFRVVIPADKIEQVFQTPLKNKLLGATLIALSEVAKRDLGVAIDGLYTAFVETGSPVELAGLSVGDVVTTVDGRQVKTLDDLSKLLATKKVGDAMRFVVNRRGRVLELTVKLGVWSYR